MMQNAKSVVARIEFRIDATRAEAEVIPLGYIVESCWDDMRWMGMIYRPCLTPNESRHINFDTWPEFADPDVLLADLFEHAWLTEDGAAGTALCRRFGPMSALHIFVAEADSDFAKGIDDPSDSTVADELISRLRKFESQLKPVCSAKVFNFLNHTPAAKTRTFNAPVRPSGGEQVAHVA